MRTSASSRFFHSAAVAGFLAVGSLAFPQVKSAALITPLLDTTDFVTSVINSSGDVACLDQGRAKVHVLGFGYEILPGSEAFSGNTGSKKGYDYYPTPKDLVIFRGPVTQFDGTTVRWIGDSIALVGEVDTTKVNNPRTHHGDHHVMVMRTGRDWSNTPEWIVLADFAADNEQPIITGWDACESGDFAAVGGTSTTGLFAQYGRGGHLNTATAPFDLFRSTGLGSAKTQGDFNLSNRLRCMPSGGFALPVSPGPGRVPSVGLFQTPSLTSVQIDGAAYDFAVGANTVCGFDGAGRFVVRGNQEGVYGAPVGEVFTRQFACSSGGVSAVISNAPGNASKVSIVDGGQLVRANSRGLPRTAFGLCVNDDASICYQDSADHSLWIDNGVQAVQVFKIGAPLNGSTVSNFTVSGVQGFNNSNTCAVNYVLKDGRCGVCSVSLNCPILKWMSPEVIKASSVDADVVLTGEKFTPGGGDIVTLSFTPSGSTTPTAVLKTRTKSNSTNERSAVVTVPASFLAEAGDVSVQVTSVASGLSSKNYVGHVTLIKQ